MRNFQQHLVAMAALIGLLSSSVLGAEPLTLGSPFSSHAVLQRDMALPVWGKVEPGTKVTVKFGGQEQSATAGADGRW